MTTHANPFDLTLRVPQPIKVPADQPVSDQVHYALIQVLRRKTPGTQSSGPINKKALQAALSASTGRVVSSSTFGGVVKPSSERHLPADWLPAITRELGPEILATICALSGYALVPSHQVCLLRIGEAVVAHHQRASDIDVMVTQLIQEGD